MVNRSWNTGWLCLLAIWQLCSLVEGRPLMDIDKRYATTLYDKCILLNSLSCLLLTHLFAIILHWPCYSIIREKQGLNKLCPTKSCIILRINVTEKNFFHMVNRTHSLGTNRLVEVYTVLYQWAVLQEQWSTAPEQYIARMDRTYYMTLLIIRISPWH